MGSFVYKKDNLAGSCVIGTGGDVFYLGINSNPLLAEAIAAMMNGDKDRANVLIKQWKEATGRLPTPASY